MSKDSNKTHILELVITILIIDQLTPINTSSHHQSHSYSCPQAQEKNSKIETGNNPQHRNKAQPKSQSPEDNLTASENEDNFSQHIVICDGQLNEDELKARISNRGGQIIKQLPLVNGYVCQLNDEPHINEVNSTSGVKRVDEDLILEINNSNKKRCDEHPCQDQVPWGVKSVQGTAGWSNLNKIKIGVVDTGIDLTHYDLIPVQEGKNIINPNQLPNDPHGHGTHVSGIISARRNGIGILGVAPEIELYPIKTFNQNGTARISSLIEGIYWSIEQEIQILNMSFGVKEDNQTLKEAITKANEAGIIMIAAAGNDGTTPLQFPARYPEVISVGAVDKENQLAEFSNYGSGLDLVAPGVNIESTWKDNQFKELDGTSMAAPHVSGVTALLLSMFDQITPQQIKRLLLAGAKPLQSVAAEKQGAGLVNAVNSIKLAKRRRA
ncbi:MAG: S8 family peptidase [Bacillota bacterium]